MYKEHIVAFIDILGFKELIKESRDNEHKAKELIINITNNFEKAIKLSLAITPSTFIGKKSPFNYKMFSDCICISCDISDLSIEDKGFAIVYFLQTVAWFQSNLVHENIFIRGGISIDKHYQDENMIFSSALVKSYEIENSKAIYPRILLDESTIKCIGEFDSKSKKEIFNILIKKDIDNLIFIDYLQYYFENRNQSNSESYTNIIKEHKKVIEKRLTIEKIPKVLHKYIWSSKYHNYIVNKNRLGSQYLIDDTYFKIKDVF